MRVRYFMQIGLAGWFLTAAMYAESVSIHVDLGNRLGAMNIDRMALGQGGLSEEPMWDSRIPEIRALRPRLIRLFVQEYFDLLPERGLYHFGTLDRSVDLIRQTGAEPLLAICFKPAVLFPKIDQDIVTPNDYEEWDNLILNLVRHYQERDEPIQYWEIGNEPDIGESGGCPYRFQPREYVEYYRHTAKAIRQIDSSARIGGPALASIHSPLLPALLEAGRSGKVPLDFISWHIYDSDPRRIRQSVDFARGLLNDYPDPKPETILDEWNVSLSDPPKDSRYQPCFIAETVWQMKEAGLDYSCYYHIRDYHVTFERFARFMSPRGTAFMTHWWNRRPQWDGLFDYQNNVRPSYFAFKLLSRLTGDRLSLQSDSETVHGFAAWDESFELYSLMLWNFSPESIQGDIRLESLSGEWRAFPIRLDAASPNGDENSRLLPEDPFPVKPDRPRLDFTLEPYGIRFWTLER